MKVLLASDTYPPDINGAARFTERLAKGLVSRGHEVHEVAPSHVGPPSVEDVDGVVVHRLRSHRYRSGDSFRICFPWEVKSAVSRLVRGLEPDVVHVQSHFVVGRYAALAAARAGVRLVATNHFMPENLVEQLPVRLTTRQADIAFRLAWYDLERVYARAQVVTAPTPRAVRMLTGTTKLKGVLDVSCGVDTDFFSPSEVSLPRMDPPAILFVGRLEQEKRVNELIEAVAELRSRVAVRAIIVGDGTKRSEWVAQAHARGVAEHVSFRGFISEEELREAYRVCAVFCMPGVAELQSLATLEAMACGMPVVAADAVAIPHLVVSGLNGWLYSPGQTGELSARLLSLLLDRERRAEMGLESRRIALGHAMEATLRTFENLYVEPALARPDSPSKRRERLEAPRSDATTGF